MVKKIIYLYRKYIPEKTKEKIYENFLGIFLHKYRHLKITIKCKFIYIFRFCLPKTNENEVYAFMGKYGVTTFPFTSSFQYKERIINVEMDETVNLPYVIHKNKKLFFPENYTNQQVTHNYRSLLIEQDQFSPHRYVEDYSFLKGKTLLDIGAAEGIFTLDTIELIDHAYIFEAEEKWIKPLLTTFDPWKHKVTIIKKFVSETNTNDSLNIDTFIKDINFKELFVKMDIEGAELLALKGMSNLLKSDSKIYLAVCTYHKEEDPIEISNFLNKVNYKYTFTEGCMYLQWWKRIAFKVLLRAWNYPIHHFNVPRKS